MTQEGGRFAAAIDVRNDEFATDRFAIAFQAQKAARTISGSHSSPARFSVRPAPATITIGTRSCTTATPRLPPAALMPSAKPFSFSGQKHEMLGMLLAKLPPATPAGAAVSAISQNGVSGWVSKYDRPAVGTGRSNAENPVQFRPPNRGTA